MRLNVYIISHPIIQKISSQARYSVNPQAIYHNYHAFYPLHTFLIYELLRKWIKGYTIYIKCIDFIKELYIFDTQESYVIITNLMNCGNIVSQINYLLPKVYVQHINFNQKMAENMNDRYFSESIINTIKNNKIIIMDNSLTSSVMQLLNYLVIQKTIAVTQIQIVCISCNNKILETIADKYPSIKIYTTKIYAS